MGLRRGAVRRYGGPWVSRGALDSSPPKGGLRFVPCFDDQNKWQVPTWPARVPRTLPRRGGRGGQAGGGRGGRALTFKAPARCPRTITGAGRAPTEYSSARHKSCAP